MQTIINSREDFNAASSAEQTQFKQILSGTIYRVNKNDAAGKWEAIEDNSTIERFGFTRADFPDAVAPELPAYIPPTPVEPEYKQLRAAAYPPIGDQLDALFHAGVFPEEMAAMIQAIKDIYPK